MQTVIFEENPKWRIYKGTFSCQICPLSRDRARILYLIILCNRCSNRDQSYIPLKQNRESEFYQYSSSTKIRVNRATFKIFLVLVLISFQVFISTFCAAFLYLSHNTLLLNEKIKSSPIIIYQFDIIKHFT